MPVDFEKDLEDCFGERMKSSDKLCENIWSALANVVWRHSTGEEYRLSFRDAGGLISQIAGHGNYMDWYCSGPYETVSDQISRTMRDRGWIHLSYEEAGLL